MGRLSLKLRLGRNHTGDDPRPKEEADHSPCPTAGGGVGPGHILALEVDRRNLDGSGKTRVSKCVVPKSFLLEQGDLR